MEKEVSFFDVEAWSKLADSCQNNGKKGRGCRVVGRLKQDRWLGADGKNRSKISIVAEHIEFKPEAKRDDESISDDAAEFSRIVPEEVHAAQMATAVF